MHTFGDFSFFCFTPRLMAGFFLWLQTFSNVRCFEELSSQRFFSAAPSAPGASGSSGIPNTCPIMQNLWSSGFGIRDCSAYHVERCSVLGEGGAKDITHAS